GDGPNAIVAGRDGVWVSDEYGATLAHIDPGTGQVRKILVGNSPRGLVLTSSGVWVAARPFAAASHRGGTLTVVTHILPNPCPAAGLRPLGHSPPRPGLRRPRRAAPVRRSSGVHTRPRPGHQAAAPRRRRHDLHLHPPPGDPLLQRRAGAGVGLPPRRPAPAQLRRLPRLLRGHSRRTSVPPAPEPVRPVRGDHHQ